MDNKPNRGKKADDIYRGQKQRDGQQTGKMKSKLNRKLQQRNKKKPTAERGFCERRHKRY